MNQGVFTTTAVQDAGQSSPILRQLAEIHRRFAGVDHGEVATYIPELAKANPDWFGICVVTVNGGVYEVGDSRQTFTIQSISKPFVYGLALEDRGRSEVAQKIGVEPTGDAFNSISLEPKTGRPRNPMINAGAIAATSLIEGRTPQFQRERILQMFANYAGRPLEIDEAVYRSESDTGHRNRAIGHMLRNVGVIEADPTPALELYFQQCSILGDCQALAVMAATLANRGINPLTGRQAIRGEYIESVLGVMGTCGMYNFAGEWLHDVGLPAKSGVAGGVIAVVPGQLGIGVFSPRLDEFGNSVRGVQVCDELSRLWDLHLFNRPPGSRAAIRTRSTAADYNSSRVRGTTEQQILREKGERIRLYQLQGNLNVTGAEMVLRELLADAAMLDAVVLDLRRVLSVTESATRLFADLLEDFADSGPRILFTHTHQLPSFVRVLKLRLGARFDQLFVACDDNDHALERCEDQLLACVRAERGTSEPPVNYELLEGLDPEALAHVRQLLRRREYAADEHIFEIGAAAHEIFFVASGHVSVVLPLGNGRTRRLATFTDGMAFGEMAALDRGPRSATIVAETRVVADVLSLDDFAELGVTHPSIKIRILENLALSLARKLRKANRELSVLE